MRPNGDGFRSRRQERGQGPSNRRDGRRGVVQYRMSLRALVLASRQSPRSGLGQPACEHPPYRRVLYAVAAYTGLRVGELRGLTVESIDFEHAVINVRRQNRRGKKLARTKTSAGRRQVPIEAALAPLLEAVCDVTADDGPLLRVPPPEDCAELVRKDLIAAECDREELFADDGERLADSFCGETARPDPLFVCVRMIESAADAVAEP